MFLAASVPLAGSAQTTPSSEEDDVALVVTPTPPPTPASVAAGGDAAENVRLRVSIARLAALERAAETTDTEAASAPTPRAPAVRAPQATNDPASEPTRRDSVRGEISRDGERARGPLAWLDVVDLKLSGYLQLQYEHHDLSQDARGSRVEVRDARLRDRREHDTRPVSQYSARRGHRALARAGCPGASVSRADGGALRDPTRPRAAPWQQPARVHGAYDGVARVLSRRA